MRVVLLALLLAAPGSAKEVGRVSSKDGLVLVFRASPVANLVYQLNCLTDIGSCTKSAYRGFWDANAWTADDAKALERWRALMNKYQKQVDLEDDSSGSIPDAVPRVAEMIDLLERLRIAAYGAETWEEYRSGLALLMTQDDAREALSIAAVFRDRFERWWTAEGRARAERSAKDLLELARRKDLPAFYGKVARFYGYAYPAGTTVEFDIVSQPENDAKHSSGEQVGDHSIVEVVPGETPENKIDVVSHELFHYFHHAAPRAVRERLIAAFAEAPEPFAFAAYGLLNESVATALGQGLVSRMVLPAAEYAKMLSEKDRLYAQSEVNDSAKELIEPLDRALARGVSIAQAEFVGDYLDAVAAGLGPRLSSPQVWFRACVLVEGPGMTAAKDKFQELTHANSVWGYTLDDSARRLLESHPGLSGALFLKPGDLGLLKGWEAVVSEKDQTKLAALAKARKPYVYGLKRSDKAYLYVFVGTDAEALSPVIADFFLAPAMFAGAR